MVWYGVVRVVWYSIVLYGKVLYGMAISVVHYFVMVLSEAAHERDDGEGHLSILFEVLGVVRYGIVLHTYGVLHGKPLFRVSRRGCRGMGTTAKAEFCS